MSTHGGVKDETESSLIWRENSAPASKKRERDVVPLVCYSVCLNEYDVSVPNAFSLRC